MIKSASSSEEVVYVDNQKIFEEFIMTNEIKTLGDREMDHRRRMLDSLYLQLNNNEGNKDVLMKLILENQKSLEDFNQSFASIEGEKIWERIKEYSKEYSVSHGYKLILGSQPDVNVLYGEDQLNKTEEFLIFINNKYEGNK